MEQFLPAATWGSVHPGPASGQQPSAGQPAALASTSTTGPAALRISYPQFLEKLKQPSAQAVVGDVRDFVGQFPANLSRPQAARRIHSFLSNAVPKLFGTSAFADDTCEEAKQSALEGLEKFVVLKLYKLLFRHAPADLREDEHVESCIRQADIDVFLPEVSPEAKQDFDAAAIELQKVEQYRSPRDKVVCLLNAHRMIAGAADEAYRKSQNGSGTAEGRGALLRDLLAALIIQASPPNLFSNVEFTIAFRHPSHLSAEERRCIQDFNEALKLVTDGREQQRRKRASTEVSAASSNEAGVSAAPTLKHRSPWLEDAGVTFHFEDRSVDDLLVGETDELLDEYHRMVRALRELSGIPQEPCSS